MLVDVDGLPVDDRADDGISTEGVATVETANAVDVVVKTLPVDDIVLILLLVVEEATVGLPLVVVAAVVEPNVDEIIVLDDDELTTDDAMVVVVCVQFLPFADLYPLKQVHVKLAGWTSLPEQSVLVPHSVTQSDTINGRVRVC